MSVHVFGPLGEGSASSVNFELAVGGGAGHEGRRRVFTLSFRDKV